MDKSFESKQGQAEETEAEQNDTATEGQKQENNKLKIKTLEGEPGEFELYAFMENGLSVKIGERLNENSLQLIEDYLKLNKEGETIKVIESNDDLSIEDRGQLAHQAVETTQKEIVEMDQLINLFRKHLSEMAIISQNMADLDLNPQLESGSKNFLLTREAANEFRSLFEKLGYNIDPISSDEGEAGFRVKNVAQSFEFAFLYGRTEKPQEIVEN